MASKDTTAEFEGETIDEAIQNGLSALGIDRAQAQVEIVQDARRGVLGFGGQKARVRVGAREAVAGVSAEGQQPVTTRSSSTHDDPAAVLGELLKLMDVPAEVRSASGQEPTETMLNITSEAGGLLIGRHGQTLDALEYLVNRIVNRHEDRGGRIFIDVEGYRERRVQELRDTATRLAARVRHTARPESMNPMSPRERRIVHMALSDDATVTTRSVGEGHLRRIVIHPAGEPRSR